MSEQICMDVDVALSEVPVNLLPLLDDTDFKSIEAAVAYNAAGMALNWHFVTTAGAYTVTAVTPTTGGDYDWTDQGTAGIYTIEIPASGGASINNDTEGFGWFTGVATGVLPWRGPVICFRAAALNNSLIDAGTTGVLAPTVAARTLDVTTTGEAGLDFANVNFPSGAYPSLGIMHKGTAAAIADGTITLESGHGITNTTIMVSLISGTNAAGKSRVATYSGTGDVFNVDPAWNATINGVAETTPSGTIVYAVSPAPPSGTTYPVKADMIQLGSSAQSATDLKDFADAGYDPSTNKVQGVVLTDTLTTYTGNTVQTGDSFARIGATGSGLTSLATQASVNTIDDFLDTEIAAIKAKTDQLTFTVANQVDANALTVAEDEILDDQLTDSVPADGTLPTVRQALYMLTQFMFERSVSGTTLTVRKADGSTSLMTFTLSDATSPVSITRAT